MQRAQLQINEVELMQSWHLLHFCVNWVVNDPFNTSMIIGSKADAARCLLHYWNPETSRLGSSFAASKFLQSQVNTSL